MSLVHSIGGLSCHDQDGGNVYEVFSEGVQWSGQLGMVLGGTLHIAARFVNVTNRNFEF